MQYQAETFEMKLQNLVITFFLLSLGQFKLKAIIKQATSRFIIGYIDFGDECWRPNVLVTRLKYW